MGKKERITGALDKQYHKAGLSLFTKRHACWHPSRERFEQLVILKSQLRQSSYIQPWLYCPAKESSHINIRCLFLLIFSWERGLNENTNRLIPQYLPKLQPLNNITQKELNYIMNQLNHRHRKTLDFKMLYKLFFKKEHFTNC
jgi:hypothetical protein